MRLAVIPARGGSKRIPRKNVALFAGRPMIGYAIAVAQNSGLFDRIVVSTDDAEIAEVARSMGAQVPFMRPAELANDHAVTGAVVVHAVQYFEAQGWLNGVDPEVCCIYPGVPLLSADDLLHGLQVLQSGLYAFPVVPFPAAIQRAMLRDADGATKPFFPQHQQTRTQDLEPAYHDAGQFYWGHASTWLSGQSIHDHARTVVLPPWRVVDIDTPDDWSRAEALHAALHNPEAA
jgi:pseudaminic acid cytidylyltransferase